MAKRVERLVRSVAAQAPDAVAVSDSERTLTYGELDAFASSVSETLRSLGVVKGDIVGLCLERSAELVVGALAILQAGGAYLAMDPHYPEERLAFMLRDSGARVLLGGPETPTTLRAETALVSVDLTQRPALSRGQIDAPPADTDDLAYVVYTSGSAGVPKGVMVQHRSLLNLLRWHQKAFDLSPSDRGTQIASPGFDAVIWELWPYLSTGASVHIPPDEVRTQPVALRDWLLTNEISISFVPTAIAEELIGLRWPSRAALRTLLTGGDVLSGRPGPGLPFNLVNNYGVTEATVVSTSGVVTPLANGCPRPSIGRPIDGVHIHLVDSELAPVRQGQEGEILIGGPSVSPGYVSNTRLTKERFISDHICGVPGELMYRTGDMARERPDGELEFLGRIDDQVMIYGTRIEPNEISTALECHPSVRSGFVIPRGEHPNRHLVAYLIPEIADPPDAAVLMSHLRRYLPDVMIPSSFIWCEQFPLNPNGKIDRAALSHTHLPQSAPTFASRPKTDTEHLVADLVAELLALNEVGLDEDFFLLGGHSLLAAQLIARLSERFNIELSLRKVFDNPTVAGLAKAIEESLMADISSLTDEDAEQLLTEFVGDD